MNRLCLNGKVCSNFFVEATIGVSFDSLTIEAAQKPLCTKYITLPTEDTTDTVNVLPKEPKPAVCFVVVLIERYL